MCFPAQWWGNATAVMGKTVVVPTACMCLVFKHSIHEIVIHPEPPL
jgi:hypothetical protein